MRIHREVLATLLLSSAGLAQQYALDRIQWVKFEDRNELAVTNQKAFTMDVPRGWPVDGGMARLSALPGIPYLRMLASDGTSYIAGLKTRIRHHTQCRTNRIRKRAKPFVRITLAKADCRSNRTRRASVMPGNIFGPPKLFGDSACSGLRFIAGKDRPDIRDLQIRQYGGQVPDANMGDHSARGGEDAGEATWTCQHGNKPAGSASWFVVTHKSSAMCTFVDCITSGSVDGLFGYIVPAGKGG